MGWLGINRNDYTVFLINWYGRPDFQFHTYTNIGPADPDTGIVIGKIRDLVAHPCLGRAIRANLVLRPFGGAGLGRARDPRSDRAGPAERQHRDALVDH
jgi:hypothetical protein